MAANLQRCDWTGADALMLKYHDEEWGLPQRDDRALFELLTLEGAQAGLSWASVLKRREGYRAAFAGFDIGAVAVLDGSDVERLLNDPGIIRNRAKIESTIANASAAIAVQQEFGSLATHLWSFVGGRPVINKFNSMAEVPAETEQSKAMSKDLRRRGFSFVGPTICYAFMQATGMVNDHAVNCFRYKQVQQA
ncbi:MAG TPA: DNA-3-methyladenine glycosylase I [Dehalococcoidia bacterium]|nr:DNA-3-methyladenine glycosylase I [Dehalococcoidia bacterium]